MDALIYMKITENIYIKFKVVAMSRMILFKIILNNLETEPGIILYTDENNITQDALHTYRRKGCIKASNFYERDQNITFKIQNPAKVIVFSFVASDGILTYLHALLLLVIVQKLWHNLRADLSHSKIFGVNLVAVNAQLNCHQSNSQPMIANTFLTRSTLTSVLLIEGLPLLVSSSMSSLREPL